MIQKIKHSPKHVFYLPAIISSFSLAERRILVYMSMVKRVLALLKMEVSELIREASITDSIRPRRPEIEAKIKR